MKMDISYLIVKAKRLLKELEELNSNPDITGKQNINKSLIELDATVQQMMIKWEKNEKF